MKMGKGGVYLSKDEYVNFAAGDLAAGGVAAEIATRQAALGAYGQYTVFLPNPDPILRKLGKSIQVYRELRNDPVVGGAIRRRKAAVLAMERGLARDTQKTRLTRNIEAILADLPMGRIIAEILDATLYGYQPIEVVWGMSGSYIVPVKIQGKPPEWFSYGSHNEPLFNSLAAPLGETLPPRRLLMPTQDPTYENPYGFADLSMVFWPVSFKKGGLGFWVKAAEKFGAPWPVGKYPRGTDQEDIDKLLDALDQMVADGVAAIADDESIALVESGKTNPSEMYKELISQCRAEINIALLGQNQTTEKDSTHASAKAGSNVTADIRDGHADLAGETVSQLIRWIVDLNAGESEPSPKYDLWEQEEIDETRAKRDKLLSEAGAKFTNAYWLRTYNLQPGDLVEAPALPPADNPAPAFAGVDASSFPAQDALDSAIEELANSGELQAQAQQILAPVFAALEGLESEDAIATALLKAYPEMNADKLTKTMTRLCFAAELAGRLSIQAELDGPSPQFAAATPQAIHIHVDARKSGDRKIVRQRDGSLLLQDVPATASQIESKT